MEGVVRKIGRHHLAFYRGWLQGLDLAKMADRYLETGIDPRKAKATLTWLREVIRQAALRNGKHSMARLLRLKVQVAISAEPSAASTPLPSLAEFREEFDPSGSFYTEKELIKAYQEAYPQSVDQKARRRQNIVARQVRALSWVEELLTTEPQPADLVSAWFDPAVSRRLMLGGIPNLLGLTERIKERGYRWWLTVPRLGEKGAANIVRWLQTYENTLGTLPKLALRPIRHYKPTTLITMRPLRTGLVPLETLLVPDELDGSKGANLHGNPKIDARNDMQAINACLEMKKPNKNTQTSYRMEIERFMLWAIIERQKALSDLTVNDCAAYRDWLSMLGRMDEAEWTYRVAQADWFTKGHARVGRHTEQWRPFVSPLTPANAKRAMGILKGMFDWLVKVQYLAFNPWSAVPLSLVDDGTKSPHLELQRMLTEWQVRYLEDYLRQRTPSPGTEQLRFAIPFAFVTGMRRSELVSATVGRLYSMPKKEEPGIRWTLNVLGKRNKWRAVPLTDSLMDRLSRYLESRGLNRDPLENPIGTPLIATQSGNKAITQDALYKAFKGLFIEIAEKLESEGRVSDAKTFRKASTHWMRHTCGSYNAAKNMPAVMIQALLGHDSLSSTSIYTHAAVADLWAEMSKNDPLRSKL